MSETRKPKRPRTEERPDRQAQDPASPPAEEERAREIGGADGPEPTRYGDWERNGRCTDF